MGMAKHIFCYPSKNGMLIYPSKNRMCGNMFHLGPLPV